MNKHILFSLFFCTITTLQSMDHDKALALPDYQSIHKVLRDDYRNYLTNKLEQYKTATVTGFFDLHTLVFTARTIQGITTGSSSYPCNSIANDIIATKDNQGNHFLHIAVEKEDKNAVYQLDSIRSRSVMMRNNNGKTVFDVCIEKMSAHSTPNQTMHEILEDFLYKMAHMSRTSEEHKTFLETSLKKVILLQLDYKKLGKKLPIKNELLMKLINFELTKEEQIEKEVELLSPFYRQAADESGDTFTHDLVKQELPDELFEWIKQGRVSFAKNKAQLTPLDVALAKFRHFTQNVMLIDADKDSFEKRRCCFFMLLHYCKIKNGQPTETVLKQCCKKHVIS